MLRSVVVTTGRGEILDGTCLVLVPVLVPVGCGRPGSIFLTGLIGLTGRAVVVPTTSLSDSSSSNGRLVAGCTRLVVVTGLAVGCGRVFTPPLTAPGC